MIDRMGQGTAAYLLHGAVLLASLEGGRIVPIRGGNAAVMVVRCRAREMRPFNGVWTGPGVQRVATLEEATMFPQVPRRPRPGWRSASFIVLTFGQQSWIRLLGIDHHQYMVGTAASLARVSRRCRR